MGDGMVDSLYIAWKYLTYNKVKTGILIACITLIAFLPMSLQVLLEESERQLLSRAVSTPLVVGAKGSALDLVMNSIYFDEEVPELISMEDARRVMDSGLANPVPVYNRFRARGFPVVGTSIDYFEFRGLKLAEGRMIAVLGECVLGAEVAERLGLNPDDNVVSSPENLFDLAGIYPLNMKVVGVLERTHTADDSALFADLKTVWVIQGLGHGHDDVTTIRDTSIIIDRTDTDVTANAKLLHFTEITEVNLNSFHFHGDLATYPITAVIASPHDAKSATLLRGRYLTEEATRQIIRPKDAIDGLLENIFRIKNIIDAVIVIVGFATVLAIVLVFALSLRLRQQEINTIFKIGCSRMTIARLLGAEIALIVVISGVLCVAIMLVVNSYSNELVRAMLFR